MGAAVDPFTHGLLGASLGYVAFGARLGRTAAWAGGLAALAPDMDVFLRSATDPLVAIEHHRGFTHSLLFTPIGAAVVAALWLCRPGWRDRGRWTTLWFCCLVGYLSHPLLDASTTYGTQLYWPFSRHRVGGDLIAIVDPAFTLVLLGGIVTALVRRTRIAAGIGLALAAAYFVVGVNQHARATRAVAALAASRGHTAARLEAMPTLANQIIWRTLYQHGGRIYCDRVRVGWFSAAETRAGWDLPRVSAADLSPEERTRNAQQSFERFAWFSSDWVARHPADATVIGDARYSFSSDAFDPIWGIRFQPPTVAGADVAWVNRARDRQLELKQLWHEVTGRDERFQPLTP